MTLSEICPSKDIFLKFHFKSESLVLSSYIASQNTTDITTRYIWYNQRSVHFGIKVGGYNHSKYFVHFGIKVGGCNHSEYLVHDKDIVHFGIKSPCEDSPCKNGDCVIVYHKPYFHCACTAGFTGQTCSAALAPFKFTTLGASGRTGPVSLGSHYQGKAHGHVTVVNGIQHWTVDVTGKYRIEAVGASGGYESSSSYQTRAYRSRGARITGSFDLSKGDVIRILVGQEGGINTVSSTSGGGGGSFVAKGNTPLIVAGGGGGYDDANTRHATCDASTSTSGNSGYGGSVWPGGTGGNGATSTSSSHVGGGGGGFYTDGSSGSNFGGAYGPGGEGGKAFLNGGVGGRSVWNGVPGGFGGGGGVWGNGGGGGGGGGYSGGGSGNPHYYACGGGGGSYNSGSDQRAECCFNDAGHGYVQVSLIG
ncbi:predicted protein [Nematostella vectensis]|uniref:EGF-like domain-containing protein n=1 Tax=Nematostella vectensis TaxID=45351 RepID=A7SYE4_NEMVE|nr:predicted protein [Nematostella vectensis]|eukprot:XP_001623371.1 predicted protein [Nematostella vectensis]